MTSELDNPYLYDDDPFDTRKDDCGCGHRRSSHWPECRAEVERTDTDALPPAAFAPGEEGDFLAWPANWPAQKDLPRKRVSCGCKGFYDPEPEPPDGY